MYADGNFLAFIAFKFIENDCGAALHIAPRSNSDIPDIFFKRNLLRPGQALAMIRKKFEKIP